MPVMPTSSESSSTGRQDPITTTSAKPSGGTTSPASRPRPTHSAQALPHDRDRPTSYRALSGAGRVTIDVRRKGDADGSTADRGRGEHHRAGHAERGLRLRDRPGAL